MFLDCETCNVNGNIVFSDEKFSPYEREVITWYINKVKSLIGTRAPRLYTSDIWCLKRLNSDNSNSNNIIVTVINEKTMTSMVEGYKFQDSNIISSVFHYLFKSYLRHYLRKYKTQEELNDIYKKYWGYSLKPIKWNNRIIYDYVVNLKFHGNQKDYYPVLSNGIPSLIELISRTSECYEPTKVVRGIASAECLISRFNGLFTMSNNNCSNLNEIVNPNLIFVTMISEYVISNYRYIGNNPAAPDIFNVIDEIIGESCVNNLGQLAYPL